MEKLIELLNEYENWKRGERSLWGYTGGMLHYIQSSNSYLDLKIISKEYGFIKRLVDNDKIDYKKTHGEEWYYKLVDTCDYNGEKRCDVLLMLLSISDTPIEDLISYLK